MAPGVHEDCRSCGEPLDVYGDHFLCCRKAGLIQRHTAVVQALWHQCTAAGFHATPEVSIDGRTRPADLLLTHWKGGGPCALDIAVVHPLAPSLPFAAVKTGREAIESMERVKRAKYAESCEKSNVAFMPIVLSTFGMSGADGTLFCNQLASAMRCSSEEEDATPNRRRQLSQQLQITLKREVARMLLQGVHGQLLSSANDTDNEAGVEAHPPEDNDVLAADLVDEHARLTDTLRPRGMGQQAGFVAVH